MEPARLSAMAQIIGNTSFIWNPPVVDCDLAIEWSSASDRVAETLSV
jgi:hypothetical protein